MTRTVLPVAACVWAAVAAGHAAGPAQAAPAGIATARALLDRYCVTCHNPRAQAGALTLDNIGLDDVATRAATWETVVRKLKTGAMPPPGLPRPDDGSVRALTSWLESQLDEAARTPNPGRPQLRRLNRAEYANVVRDLLAVEIDVKTLLPADDSAFGFDNIADLLVVSPALLERYMGAADQVSALAVGDTSTAPGSDTYHVRGEQSQSQHLDGLPLGTVGGLAVRHTFPLDADYEFKVTLFRTNLEAIRGLEHPHQLEIGVDGERVFLGTIGGKVEEGQSGTITERSDATDARLRVRIPVKAGPRVVTASFVRKMAAGTNRLRPFLRSNSGTYDSTGRPHIETLTVSGPFNPTGPGDTPSRRRIFTCRPAAAADEEPCARRILSAIAHRAYRRPVTGEDTSMLLAFYREGRARGGFESAVQLALRRMLASPSFLFRIEAEPAALSAGAAYRVSDVELASRLSFFLWSSMPDDGLLALAERGRLRDPGVLESEVRRMLADPRAVAFVENFAGQWLHLRNLQTVAPNSDEFPDFDNDLREAFRREAELFFASIVGEDRNVLDLLTADDTFVNERLARHYGIPHVYGSHFRRVTVTEDARRGLLGKGSILLTTSRADRTAPVLRGKWVLENLLGTPPPPPLPNVPALPAQQPRSPKTMRERMEVHRANPSCAGCHRPLDGLGFTMENFNAVGAWRTHESGVPIDASGLAGDGSPVSGVVGLREALVRRPEVFVGTLTEKLLTYALGRGLQYYDMPVVRRIVRKAAADRHRFSALVLGIVESAPFQMRAKAPRR